MFSYIAEKASKASFSVTRKWKSAGYLTPHVGLFLFDTYVLPILTFGCEMWFNVKDIPKIETFN